MSSAPNVAINAKRNKQIAAPCLTTNLIISAESSLSVSDSSQRSVFDILRAHERTEDAGFDFRSPFSFTASRFVRVRQLAYSYGATTLSFSRPTAAPDWAHVFLGSTAEQGPSRRLPRAHSARKRAGICPQHEAGDSSLPQVSQTLTAEFKASEWSFRQVLFKLCNWGARLSSCSTE